MNTSDFKKILEDLVHTELYTSVHLSDEQIKKYNNLKKYMRESKCFIEDLRTIISSKNNENYYAYDKYITEILLDSMVNTRLDFLYNQDKYEDIIKNDEIYIKIWDSFDEKTKIEYLTYKKKYTDTDIALINSAVKEYGSFKDNIILNEILYNEDINNKISPFSIELNYSFNLLSLIKLTDYDTCNILTKESYTTLLLKKCKSFDDFLQMYTTNNKIFNLIQNNSLTFYSNDDEVVYNFLMDKPNFIGKFNKRYLDLFNIMDITQIVKTKNLDEDTYSAILQKLYKFNPEEASKFFDEENLEKCARHSIEVYPFEYINEELQNKIFNTYTLFNRFMDTIMIEAINNRFSEDDIVNILRNDTFVQDVSSYAIELLLNKLSFKATFNMLQRKIIFDKISNLHVKVEEKDAIFFKGFLDSPILVHKSEHNMLFEMLKLLDKDDVLYYVTLPYVMNNLSNYEIINLAIDKKISVLELVESSSLKDKLNTTDIISYIDKSFLEDIDLNIFKNKTISKQIFNLSDEQFDNINFDEVNYLFETVRMKSVLSKQDSRITVLSYKSVLASYLLLGLDETIRVINDGNKDVTLGEVKDLQTLIVNEKVLQFKERNSSVFQNMGKKIMANLHEIGFIEDINLFAKKVRKNSFLDNIIYLMLDSDYDTYNGIIEKLYNYLRYFNYDEFASKKDIYDYSQAFTELYIQNKVTKYNNEFEKIILINFKPKENVIYNKRKEIGKDFLDRLKFKLFVRSLTDTDKDIYANYFREGYPLEKVKDKYIKYLGSEEVDFESILEHVLLPIVNDRFDKENCLSKLGINKPKSTDSYLKYLNDLKIITDLNIKLDRYIEKYNSEEMISIMNYICYNIKLPFKVKKKDLNNFDKYAELSSRIIGEVYIDKSVLKFIYKDNLDIYNIDEIIEYTNYLDILNNIIDKTYNYVSRNMDVNKIRSYFAHDYFNAINTDDCVFPINSKHYEPKKRVLSIKDLERVFNGYDLSGEHELSESLKNFLFNEKNLVMVADGYYDGLVDNLGIIISKWNKILEHAQEKQLDASRLNLIQVNDILKIVDFDHNILGKAINKKVIKSITEDGYYEINDINRRINILIDLYRNSFKRVSSSVPYLTYKDDIYRIKVLDNYDQDILATIGNSLYKVGAIGNDFLHYSIINKNGFQIGIYKDNKLISKVLGVRNGNTIYLNALDGEKDNNYNELLRLFANELIRVTKDDLEPVLYVTIVNNDVYSSRNGLKIDSTVCPIINDPINRVYYDFDEFTKNENLLNVDELYTNYQDSISTLLASNCVVDKNNFKYYDADAKYYRKRNHVTRLSNNISEEYLNRINTIIYLCKLEDKSIDVNNIMLSMIDTIYLGDDYVIFVTNKDKILKFVLPYDDRAIKEMEVLIEKIKKDL